MYLLILFAAIFAVLLFWSIKSKWNDVSPCVLIIFSSFFLFITILTALIGPSNDRSKIREMEAVRKTINEQRIKEISPFERAQLTQTIIQYNTWLAGAQYWRQSPWRNIFHDESVMTTQFLK